LNEGITRGFIGNLKKSPNDTKPSDIGILSLDLHNIFPVLAVEIRVGNNPEFFSSVAVRDPDGRK
jgi:hypothetical protein